LLRQERSMYDALLSFERDRRGLDRSTRSFFGAMAGFILLDAALLLWLVNPFAGLAPRTHTYPLLDQAAVASMVGSAKDVADKPSPFAMAQRATAARGGAGNAMRTAPAFVEVNH
jgi:hypothetical protein